MYKYLNKEIDKLYLQLKSYKNYDGYAYKKQKQKQNEIKNSRTTIAAGKGMPKYAVC